MRRAKQLEQLQAEMRVRWQAGRGRVGPGRPACQLDQELVFIGALHGLTQAEIARRLGCDPKTLRRCCGPALERAARSRAALLPRALWQRGPNLPDKLAANFAEKIQRQEPSLDELTAMLWAAPPEVDPDFAGRMQTSGFEQQSREEVAQEKGLKARIFPAGARPKKAKKMAIRVTRKISGTSFG